MARWRRAFAVATARRAASATIRARDCAAPTRGVGNSPERDASRDGARARAVDDARGARAGAARAVGAATRVERGREGGIDETRWRFARARKTARRRVAGRRRARAGRGHGR